MDKSTRLRNRIYGFRVADNHKKYVNIIAMRKNYNFTRRKLYLPEYGRHIHEMVDSLLEIEDRHERTRQAKAVIAVMGNLNPTLRDTEDFKHKLWDHLFIMSDFRLDVDSPYSQPSRQDLTIVPQKLRYPQSRITFKHYGKYLQQFVDRVSKEKGGMNEMVNLARYMRTKSYEFNNEHPNNESIMRDIRVMAGGEVEMDLSTIATMRSEYRSNVTQRNQKRGKQQTQGRSNNGRKVAKSANAAQGPRSNQQSHAPRSQQRHAQHK